MINKKELLEKVKKTSFTSLCMIIAIALISTVIGSVAAGWFTLRYIFTVNFLVAVIIIASGVILQFLPVLPKRSKLIDQTTLAEFYRDERDKKSRKSHELIYLGLCNLLLTGTIQLLLSFMI